MLCDTWVQQPEGPIDPRCGAQQSLYPSQLTKTSRAAHLGYPAIATQPRAGSCASLHAAAATSANVRLPGRPAAASAEPQPTQRLLSDLELGPGKEPAPRTPQGVELPWQEHFQPTTTSLTAQHRLARQRPHRTLRQTANPGCGALDPSPSPPHPSAHLFIVNAPVHAGGSGSAGAAGSEVLKLGEGATKSSTPLALRTATTPR